MKVTCDVIKDILPLYAENISSEDTKRLVEDHINSCTECKNELKEMIEPKSLPIDINTTSFDKLKSKLFIEKFKVIIISIILTLFVSVLVFKYLTEPIYLPYSKEILSLSNNENGTITINFNNKVDNYDLNKYLSEDGTSYVYHITTYNTIWNDYFIKNNLDTIVLNPNGEDINSIYYYSGSSVKSYSKPNSEDVLLYGKDLNNRAVSITMPRLFLSYYLIIAVILTIILTVIRILVNKYKTLSKFSERILLIPISYIIGHLCIKGFISSSYSASRDLYLILLISIPIYFIFIVSIYYYRKYKIKGKSNI